MTEWLSTLPAAGIGISGLLGVAVILILHGDLVPRRYLDDVRADRDHWRSVHADSERGRAEAVAQLREMLELARTQEHVISSLPRPTDSPSPGGPS